MINYVWSLLIIVGISCYLFTGNISALNNELLTNSKKSLDLVLNIMPIIVLWSGIMKIAEDGGLLKKVATKLDPVLRRLFPTVKKDSLALGYISSNIAANMLGLGSAATPFGLKAMQELQKENNKKKEASEAMITFLVLNTAGVTIIPTTVLALRTMYHSSSPSSIIAPSIIATFCASLAGLLMDYIVRKKKR